MRCGFTDLRVHLARSTAYAAGLRVDDIRNLISRTPHRALSDALPVAFRVAVPGRDKWSRRATPIDAAVEATYRRQLRTQSVTCWHRSELRHPVFFFEQRIRCPCCGAERFRTTNPLACCRGGKLLLEARLPDALLDVMTGTRTDAAPISAQARAQGISKCSRALNNKFRFAQMRLPKVQGERQAPTADSYQHLRITGVPYAQIENMHVVSSTRSFLDDPTERMGTWATKAGVRRSDVVAEYGDGEGESAQFRVASTKWASQPHAADVRVFEEIMLHESPIVDSLVNHAADARDAYLVLKYEGTTTSVRAFTTLGAAAVVQPREVAFSWAHDGSKVTIRSTHPMYPALMWPLFFPRGQPLPYRKDGRVPLWDVRMNADARSEAAMGALSGLGADMHGGRTECWSIAQMALALLYQPKKRTDGEVHRHPVPTPNTFAEVDTFLIWQVMRHPTISPYTSEASQPIYRPFSKLELCGRLGDEVLLDMFLSAEDARLHYLSLPSVQQRITGQFQAMAETVDDAEALSRGSYLPPSVQGGPRHLRECIANALTAVNDTPCAEDLAAGHGPHSDPCLFGTMTVSVKEWLEVQTELPTFGGMKQDPFDRAGLTTEVFAGKLAALLARLRTGTIFPNIGRPTAAPRAAALRKTRNEGGVEPPPHAGDARYRTPAGKAKLVRDCAEWLERFNSWCDEWKDESTHWDADGECAPPPPGSDASDDGSTDDGGASDDEDDQGDEEGEGAAPRHKKKPTSPFERARLRYHRMRAEYIFPLSTADGGYIIYSIEYQGRGLAHVHFVWRPAKLVNVPGYARKTTPGESVEWADQLVCAKIPTYEVLHQFGMLLPRNEILQLEGVCDPGSSVPRPAYTYLNDRNNGVNLVVGGERCYFVQPEIAHDFGLVAPAALLAEMLKLTVGEGAKGDPPTHWSQKAGQSNVKSLEGNMIHYHVSGGPRPNKWCAKHGNADACDSDFPMPTAARTMIGEDRRVLYKREEHEVWVVPYNPWLLLYFRRCATLTPIPGPTLTLIPAPTLTLIPGPTPSLTPPSLVPAITPIPGPLIPCLPAAISMSRSSPRPMSSITSSSTSSRAWTRTRARL
jgi:hypothetical protein